MGPVAVAHGLSCPVVCGIFLEQGSNPCPTLTGGFLTTGTPEKSTMETFCPTFYSRSWEAHGTMVPFMVQLSEQSSTFLVMILW